jgi:hypothetical protein
MMFNGPRGNGKTHQLVKACLAIRGIFVVHNAAFAHRLSQQYPTLDVVSIHQDMCLVGSQRPLFFDHLVTEHLMTSDYELRQQLSAEQHNHQKTREERDNYKVRLDLERKHTRGLEDSLKAARERGGLLDRLVEAIGD